ncbi:MAG: CpaF family protein, partial [Lachnospiraceae bacterium]|nr:CpaF family protein [Lachnospiraceae bacterium]
QIASGIDIIVQLGRLRDRTRRVLEIAEVVGMKEDEIRLETLCVFEEESGSSKKEVKGRLVFKKELANRQKLLAAGLSDLPPF